MRYWIKGIGLCALAAAALSAQAKYNAVLIEYSKAWAAAIADYNNDGHDDIYITGHDPNDRIWYWTANGYVASSQGLELPVHSDRHDCSPADVNLDGRMDFYCTVGAAKGSGGGDNELWLQKPDGTHEMVGATRDFGAKDNTGRGRRTVFFDFNHDGLPDIFLTNLAELRDDGLPNVNRVFINQGDATFAEAPTIATGVFGSACVAKGDVNQDGWDDILVCSDNGAPHLYVNNRKGDFTELPIPTTGKNQTAQKRGGGSIQRLSWGKPVPMDVLVGDWVDAKFADMNADGRTDLVVITRSNRLQIWKNTGKEPYFSKVMLDEPLPNIGASLAVADFNHDGRPDVYVVLRDLNCEDTLKDLAPDVVYKSRSKGVWKPTTLNQNFAGCGHMADIVNGDRVLLLNGGGGWKGPNYLIQVQ
jgi:FG-GAP-like repeat